MKTFLGQPGTVLPGAWVLPGHWEGSSGVGMSRSGSFSCDGAALTEQHEPLGAGDGLGFQPSQS